MSRTIQSSESFEAPCFTQPFHYSNVSFAKKMSTLHKYYFYSIANRNICYVVPPLNYFCFGLASILPQNNETGSKKHLDLFQYLTRPKRFMSWPDSTLRRKRLPHIQLCYVCHMSSVCIIYVIYVSRCIRQVYRVPQLPEVEDSTCVRNMTTNRMRSIPGLLQPRALSWNLDVT